MRKPNTNQAIEHLDTEMDTTFKLLNANGQVFSQPLRKYGLVAWEHVVGAHYVDYEAAQSVHLLGRWHDGQSLARLALHKIAPQAVERGEAIVRERELVVVQRPLTPGYNGDEPTRIGTSLFGETEMIEFTEGEDAFAHLSHTTTVNLGAEAIFGFFDGWSQEYEGGQFAGHFTSSPETAGHLIGALQRGTELGWKLF